MTHNECLPFIRFHSFIFPLHTDIKQKPLCMPYDNRIVQKIISLTVAEHKKKIKNKKLLLRESICLRSIHEERDNRNEKSLIMCWSSSLNCISVCIPRSDIVFTKSKCFALLGIWRNVESMVKSHFSRREPSNKHLNICVKLGRIKQIFYCLKIKLQTKQYKCVCKFDFVFFFNVIL